MKRAKQHCLNFLRWLDPLGVRIALRTGSRAEAGFLPLFSGAEEPQILATSVVEVGVDIPNATVMIVFDAERLGLAQLHPLRGLIGHGGHKSYGVLVTGGDNPEAASRLRTLEQVTDGSAVAEADLRLRGPGELLGTAQSGLPGLQPG